mmetsp:Transcript_137901/g.344245  ORF Transcript_137901/g.344245 Transcript_137901/m.344245 type:complete len:321 (+) Transcript_137901:69-1031(+)
MVREAEMISGECSSQEEGQGVYHDGLARTTGSRAVGAVLGFVGLVAIVALLAFNGSAHPTPAAAPLTVRALLESDELADLTTKNLLAAGGGETLSGDAGALRGQVGLKLRNVSEAIRTNDPEAHRLMGQLDLTSDQKEAALRVVRKFGDPRMLGLARDVAEAARQAKEESGDDEEALKRRLSEALASKTQDLQQLGEELFPGQRIGIDAAAALPQLRKWHPSVSVDLSSRRRLLSETDSVVEQGVQAHAHTLFKSLEAELGDRMPAAPARMLSESSGGKLSFMACVTKAVPNPTKVCTCITNNLSEVMKLMKDFMKGKMR